MTVLTKQREHVLERLVELAGDPLIVQQALRELNAELPESPSLEILVLRILELRERAATTEPAATIPV